MKQIITIQHTQSIHHTNGMVGSWTDWDLSESGIEQAERIGQKLAKQLSGHKIVMYASDLLRAKHTAEIVAKHMGITPNIRTELRERNLGKCVGKSVQWLRENIARRFGLLLLSAVAQPLAALPPYGCGTPLAGAALLILRKCSLIAVYR